MNDLIFKPIIPLSTMIIFSVVMLAIVVLNRKHIINRILILVLLLIISQRPMLRNQEDLTYSLDIDVLFVIDNTASMNAVDINNDTRLNAVKRDCKYIVDKLLGASFGVITFSNFSQIRMPFTHDSSDILEIIDGIKVVDPAYAIGSTLDLPYDDMEMLLESSESKEEHRQVVFYISDGELTSKEQSNTNFSKFSDLKAHVDDAFVFGYGTTNGGKIKITSTIARDFLLDKDGFLLDKTGGTVKTAISKINEDNLKTIATNFGAKYYRSPSSSDINNLVENIIAKAQKNRDDTEYSDKDLYYYFSIALLFVLFWELLYYRRNEQ